MFAAAPIAQDLRSIVRGKEICVFIIVVVVTGVNLGKLSCKLLLGREKGQKIMLCYVMSYINDLKYPS